MATAEEYASWITANADKRGTPEFETVAQAYQATRAAGTQRTQPLPSHASQPANRTTIMQDAANVGAGAAQGAASIGSTLMGISFDPAARALGVDPNGTLGSFVGRRDRRTAVTDALQGLGADTSSLPFKVGEVGAQIAGTGGLGSALGRGAAAVGLPRLAQALSSGGFAVRGPGAAAPTGMGAIAAEQGIRAAGGAIGGGAAAALVNPDDVAVGATIGGLLPGAARVAWLAGRGAGNVLAQPFRSVESRVAPTFGAVMPQDPTATRNALASLRAGGQQFVPGSVPNAAEISMDPGIANLVRAVQASGGRQLFDQAEANALARTAALGQVGRFGDNVAQAREDLGQEVTRRIIPEERAISDQIRTMFQNVDPQGQAALNLPLDDLAAQVERYLGPGTVGPGAQARAALDTARGIGTEAGPPVTTMSRVANARGVFHQVPVTTPGPMQPALVGWEELQNLRGSIGSLARSLRRDPATAREAAALESMQAQLDTRVAEATARSQAAQNAQRQLQAAQPGSAAATAAQAQLQAAQAAVPTGEVFTPQMAAAWQAARAAHANKVERFREGPQRRMFTQDASGQPQMAGGEIPAAFWNSTPGQAGDVAAFRRLVDDNPHMVDQLRGLALTEAQQGTNAAGDLTQRAYSNWLANRTPALNALMDPGQMQALQAIGMDLDRAAAAQGLGRVSGSDTMQKATAMMGNALLENPVVGAVANRIPIIGGAFSGPALAAMRDAARRQRAAELAAVLADPNRTATALEILLRQQQPLGRSASNALGLGYRAVPAAIPGTD